MRKKLKTQVYALEKGYNEITFGLKRVRNHMGRMMTRIREFKSHLYATDKQSLKLVILRFSSSYKNCVATVL